MRRVYGIFLMPFARLYGISLARTTILRNLAASGTYGIRNFQGGIFSLRSSDVIAQRSLRKEEYSFACDVALGIPALARA